MPRIPLVLFLTLFISWPLGAQTPDQTEILWDNWGVPHVYGASNSDLFRAFGWAQMHSHGNLILQLYGQARGRGAEYWGAPFLGSDRWVRTMGVPERASEWYDAQTAEFRGYLDDFAAGMNQYVEENPDAVDEEVKQVLPVTPIDVLAHSQRLVFFTFLSNPGLMRQAAASIGESGSNAWAIAPSRSASGNAMLLLNPHLAWQREYLWYEAHLIGPETNFTGAFFVGFPSPMMGFNDQAGYANTVNTLDAADLFELTLTDGGYRWNGSTRPFDIDTQIVRIREEGGTLREETLELKSSIHGPVIAERGVSAIALRVAGLDQPGMLRQGWEMMRVENLTDFETILSGLQLPFLNMLYAGQDGHIQYQFNGQVPVRPMGDWSFWAGSVPGDTSSTLWTRTHPIEDLPQLTDPPSGWIQNANDPPWTTTFPQVLHPSDYPAYMAPSFMHFRAQQSATLLGSDSEVSFQELEGYKHNTRMLLADRVLDELIPAARAEGSELALRAVEILEAWDRQALAESRGAVLFIDWVQQMGQGLFAEEWDAASPTTTPDGLTDPAAAVSTLVRSAQGVIDRYGVLDPPFGEVYRLRRGEKDLPANGAPGDPFGVFRTVYYAPTEDGRFQAAAGDSFYAVLEFSNPIKARVLMSYGNSTQPGSIHGSDQLELFSRQEMRPAWRTRAEIEANLEFRVELNGG